jgi:hypothetical protein
MMKKILATSLIGLVLIVSGCGETEGEDRLAIQQMLDSGDYSGVISALEPIASTDDDFIALGAAYMGRAGLSLSNIVTAMVTSVDENEGDSAFAGFVTGIATTSTSTALPDLGKSVDYYEKVVESACSSSDTEDLSNTQRDICLYIGLASTGSAAVTIDLIAGDIESFGDSNSSDDKLTASICAIQYGADNRSDANVDASCSISEGDDVNFTTIGKVYTDLNVTVNGETYYYLLNDLNETLLTSDYCTATDFSTRTATYIDTTPAYYACPINETNTMDELTTAGILVDVLNSGVDAIGSAASEETQGDIDEFKCEILGGTYDNESCDVSLDTNVTSDDIIDYLNNQN